MRHGSQIDPPNRFESVHAEPDLDHMEWDTEYLNSQSNRPVEYLPSTRRADETVLTVRLISGSNWPVPRSFVVPPLGGDFTLRSVPPKGGTTNGLRKFPINRVALSI